jgi:hypothetical protein
MRKTPGRIRNMVRNTKKREKGEMYTVEPGIWRENSKTWKMRNTHCRTLNISIKLTKEENEKLT